MPGMLSPGVRWRELDFSTYVATLSTTTVAMVGGANKGVMNTPTLITNQGELASVFGTPTTDDYGLFAAKSYLEYGSQLYYIRVGDGTEEKATADYAIGVDSVFECFASSEGIWPNDLLRFRLTDGSASGLYNFQLEWITGSGSSDYYVIEGPWQDVNFDEDDSVNFIETVINKGRGVERESQLITIDVVWDYVGQGADPVPTPAVDGDVEIFSGGLSGLSGLGPADYIGTDNGYTKTGLQTVTNPEDIDINLLLAPGVSDMEVHSELISICENERRDCFTILDPEFGLGVQDVVDFHNGVGAYSARSAVNSSYAAFYWPWIEIYDADVADRLYVPPSGLVAQKFAYNDFNAAVWFAPAGLKRGLLSSALGLEVNPNVGQRNILYSGGNVINPIMSDTPNGIYINGQRTALRQSSSLDRVAPRRTLTYMQKTIATAVKYLVFDPNDETTWNNFKGLVTPVFEVVKKGRGITEYDIIVDETTNPPLARDRKEMNGLFKVKLAPAAEFITMDFALYAQGARF